MLYLQKYTNPIHYIYGSKYVFHYFKRIPLYILVNIAFFKLGSKLGGMLPSEYIL